MKRNLLFLVLGLLVLAGSASAQKGFYFGANGTLLNTWTTNQMNYGKADMDYKITFNPAGNVNVAYHFNDNMGLVLQAGYAVLGQKYEDMVSYPTGEDTSFTRRVSMGYLVFPLMFKYRTSGEMARFYIMAGPQFNVLVKAKQDYFKDEVASTETIWNPELNDWVKVGEEDITDQFVPFDIMARIDFGAEFSLTDNLFITAGMQLGYGLTDINDSNWQYPNPDSGTYNPSHNLYGGISIGINYSLNSKKE